MTAHLRVLSQITCLPLNKKGQLQQTVFVEEVEEAVEEEEKKKKKTQLFSFKLRPYHASC